MLYRQIRDAKLLEPHREYRFHERRWRFDFAWPHLKFAVEVEGGVWSRGRHTRGAGFVRDCEKYAEAIRGRWLVLRVPTQWVNDGTALSYVSGILGREYRITGNEEPWEENRRRRPRRRRRQGRIPARNRERTPGQKKA